MTYTMMHGNTKLKIITVVLKIVIGVRGRLVGYKGKWAQGP